MPTYPLTPPISEIPPIYEGGGFETFLKDDNTVAGVSTGEWDRDALSITASKRTNLGTLFTYKRISSTGLWPQASMSGIVGTVGPHFSSLVWGQESVADYNSGGTPIYTDSGIFNPSGGGTFGSYWFWADATVAGGPGTHVSTSTPGVEFSLVEVKALVNLNYQLWVVSSFDSSMTLSPDVFLYCDPPNGGPFGSDLAMSSSGTISAGTSLIIPMPSFTPTVPPAPDPATTDVTDANNWSTVGNLCYIVLT